MSGYGHKLTTRLIILRNLRVLNFLAMFSKDRIANGFKMEITILQMLALTVMIITKTLSLMTACQPRFISNLNLNLLEL